MNSLAFPTGIARLCAEFGVVCVSPLGGLQTAFHNIGIVGSKLFALVLKSYRPFLSSTSPGLCRGWFFSMCFNSVPVCARQEGLSNV